MVDITDVKKQALEQRVNEIYSCESSNYYVSYSTTDEGLVAEVRWNNSLNTSKFVWEKNNYGAGYVWARKSDD